MYTVGYTLCHGLCSRKKSFPGNPKQSTSKRVSNNVKMFAARELSTGFCSERAACNPLFFLRVAQEIEITMQSILWSWDGLPVGCIFFSEVPMEDCIHRSGQS